MASSWASFLHATLSARTSRSSNPTWSNASTLLKSSASERTPPRRRELALALVLLAPLVAVFLAVPRIVQDARYHAFADTRTVLGAPNFANVASNLPFLIIGVAGLAL